MNALVWLRALGLLQLVVWAVGCGGRSASAPDELTQPRVPVVKAIAVAMQNPEHKTVQPASVSAYYQAAIRAKVSGYIAELNVDIGDVVEAGAVLARIDVPEIQMQTKVIEAQVARARAEETRATAGVELAAAEVRSNLAKLEQAKAQVASVEASLAAAESEYARTSDLVQRQTLQGRVLDEVRLTRDSQLAAKNAVQAAIESAEALVAVARAEQTSAEANLLAAQAETQIAMNQMEEIMVKLQYATLTAPFAGIVSARYVSPGDLVAGEREAQPLLEISQVDRVRIHIPLPEVDAALVKPGDAVSFQFPSFPAEETLSATVTRFSGTLDASTRSMLVEVEVDNTQRKLLPGMFGQATLVFGSEQISKTLPARAIRYDDAGNAYVYVLRNDESISKSPVTTGRDDGSSIEILSGVEAGQHVIDAHLQRFTDGQKVVVLSK